jgi:hypothetical protein
MAMEKQCTYLIFDETVARSEPSELAAGLEASDPATKIATMKKIIILMLNGEQLGSLLMKVIQFVVPNDVGSPIHFHTSHHTLTATPPPPPPRTVTNRCFPSPQTALPARHA